MTEMSKSSKSPKPKSKGTKMSSDMSDVIGQRLRSFYDDASKLPIPDRFLDLLNKLEATSPPEDKK
jgi:hypothetical protein